MPKPEDELPSLALVHELRPPRFQAAGDADTQRQLNRLAWEMVETCTNPYGLPDTRFQAGWLARQGWRAELLPRDILNDEAACDRIAAAIARHAQAPIVGVAVSAGCPIPSRAWRLIMDGVAFNLFFMAHTGIPALLAPEDRGFAVLGDEDVMAIAGPNGFVRDARGDIAAARSDFEENRKAEERMGRPGWLNDVVQHYLPFALRL